MTNEQAAPQSEEKPLEYMLNSLRLQLKSARSNALASKYPDRYTLRISEIELAIRILEAWPEIKRTLEEYGNEENWSKEIACDEELNVFDGMSLEDKHGFVPAQRALALAKPISRNHENGTEVKP